MGLPRNIPSGDDSNNEPSLPLLSPDEAAVTPKRAPAQRKNAQPAKHNDAEMQEFEEYKRWKRLQKEAEDSQQLSTGEESSAQQPISRTSSTRLAKSASTVKPISASPTRTRQPTRSRKQPVESPQVLEDSEAQNAEDNWSVDPKTGKRYKQIKATPKEAIKAYGKTNGRGLSKEEMLRYIEVEGDFDIDDLNNTAETFMAHLRVPPSKEEQQEILRKKSELAEKRRRERQELDDELNASEGVIPEPEADPFNQSKDQKRGLFGRKQKKK